MKKTFRQLFNDEHLSLNWVKVNKACSDDVVQQLFDEVRTPVDVATNYNTSVFLHLEKICHEKDSFSSIQ